MGVFVSYSSRDKEAVARLSQDLQDAEEQVWLDQRLAGGDAWWRAILEQIRGCDVFIFALSQNSIQSKPCQAELHYAQGLGLPILPVQVGPVDSMQLNPLATVQTVDYRTSASTVGMRLLSALNRARTQRQPLPSPLPEEPPVPFEYLIRLYTTIAGTDYLSPPDQAALVAQLQFGLREDGEHDAARNDIRMLLTKLRDREDVTYHTRTEVEALLAGIDKAVAGPQPVPLLRADARPPEPATTIGAQLSDPEGAATTDTRETFVRTPAFDTARAEDKPVRPPVFQPQTWPTREQEKAESPSRRRGTKIHRRMAAAGAILLLVGFVFAGVAGSHEPAGHGPWTNWGGAFLSIGFLLLMGAIVMGLVRLVAALRHPRQR
jgi:hypothetical protein